MAEEPCQVFEKFASFIFRSCISTSGAVLGICGSCIRRFKNSHQLFFGAAQEPFYVFVGAVSGI